MTRTNAKKKLLTAMLMGIVLPLLVNADAPRAVDDRLTVELFAEHPQIVTPTGLAVDGRGRVYVAESHTHFRPEDYDGPKADRILILEDTDGDGRADSKKVFHEGFKYVMDIEFHHDGSLYVATRMDIHRLRDTNGDDQADKVTPIVKLETKGDYPHNGLSGIAFDLRGGFHFGLGENLGEPYTVIGSDGTQISGGGEGGSTYWIDDNGRRLRRVTTGWWNPYGMCTDSFDRVFGTDNDPDASPPCRLIQVVEGGDYGYEFRYGRSGRNPLITWDGEIPGTLPMIAGTGEAPCHIVAYESDALPEEYFGSLLVSVWADHRVEQYPIKQKPEQGLVSTKRQTLVEGPDDFRPVGIDVAPDGTVYISDWVSSSYTLHKLGRVWRIRPKEMPKKARPEDIETRVLSRDRRTREAAARELSQSPNGREVLQKTLRWPASPHSPAQATCLQVLAFDKDATSIADNIVKTKRYDLRLQILAARFATGGDKSRWDFDVPVAVQAALLGHVEPWQAGIGINVDERDLLGHHHFTCRLSDFLFRPDQLDKDVLPGLKPLDVLLALKRKRATNPERADVQLDKFLDSSDPVIRFMAIKWVADDRLVRFRPKLEAILDFPDLDLRSFLAVHVALDRLDGKPLTDRPTPERLLEKITNRKTSPVIVRLAVKLMDPSFPGLRIEHLARLLEYPDVETRVEAVRTLARLPDPNRFAVLISIAKDFKQNEEVRAAAVGGLSANNQEHVALLVELAAGGQTPLVRDEALRALVGAELTADQKSKLSAMAERYPKASESVLRLVQKTTPHRPAAEDTDAWLKSLQVLGDAKSGEYVFFGNQVGTCSKCHQAGGRGESVGPDLTRINSRVANEREKGRAWLMKTILQPGRDMAPQYTPWAIVTKDGKRYVGLPRRKGGNAEAYLGTDGKEFTLKIDDIESHHESNVSIMPANLLQQLTPQELADLFAFLTAEQK